MFHFIIQAMWYIIPAYVSNSSAVLLKGKTPIDFGKKFVDGRPIFGKGKTIRGFFLSVLFGTFIGLLQAMYQSVDPSFLIAQTGFVFGLCFFAMFGDLAASFLKRRLNIKRGKALPLLDQWDFIIGALVFAAVVGRLPNLIQIITIFVITPVLHVSLNFLVYKLNLKEVPW